MERMSQASLAHAHKLARGPSRAKEEPIVIDTTSFATLAWYGRCDVGVFGRVLYQYLAIFAAVCAYAVLWLIHQYKRTSRHTWMRNL